MFRPSRVHWAIFFPEKYLKTSSTLVWKLLRTFVDTFKNSIFFDFFSNFYKFWSPGCTGQEKFGKNHLKTCLDTLRNVFEHFWNFKLFSIFFRIFPSFDSPGCTGQFFNQKNYLEACSKHVWLLLGTFFGHFENLKVFPVSWSFPKFRISRVHWAFFSEKITSKQVQNLFGHF